MPKIKGFKTGYGLSVEIKGVWHKLNCEIELELLEGEDFPSTKEKAWNTVVDEVEKQIQRIIE